ncbi:MAG: hypothetical protein ACD_4C00394G0002 [uncultured bacterium (gcode 4)]|uniref:Glycosyltransferase RgtA/B/C/D-like domain-containing protein n=1 Tax=uncultured bacterium (gcode 4) TaxID=1234023 RepID=K2FWD6_9BACT|nr:MAG: hypothetical protein ACD_4C00394G0002 [uncultured bacterium (gcode 4)]
MFDTSLLFDFKAILLNLLIPIIPWILILWIFFWNKFSWTFNYLYGWFLWIWTISFSLFNLQFLYFWIWVKEYFWLVLLLILILSIKAFFLKQNYLFYFKTLKLEIITISQIKKTYLESTSTQKILSALFLLSLVWFMFISFFTNITFPTYFDDTFGNWNKPAINIYNDWGVKMFWAENEILWRWRLWYPIFIPIYKAVITDFFWKWNEIYINLFQFISFLLIIIFITHISFKHTKNIFKAILPIFLISWIPLVYFHIIDWYLDFICAVYAILMIYNIFIYLKDWDFDNFSLWMAFWFILSYMKNDGFIVYFSWVIFSFLIVLFIKKNIKIFLKELIQKRNLLKNLFFLMYFFAPFYIIKSYYNLWWNQAAWEKSWVGLSFHSEIFNIYPEIFFNENNFNLMLIFFWIAIFSFLRKKIYNNSELLFIILSPVLIFIILNVVFLFTSNFAFALNQTTINRVFMVDFVIFLAYTSFFIQDEKQKIA